MKGRWRNAEKADHPEKFLKRIPQPKTSPCLCHFSVSGVSSGPTYDTLQQVSVTETHNVAWPSGAIP